MQHYTQVSNKYNSILFDVDDLDWNCPHCGSGNELDIETDEDGKVVEDDFPHFLECQICYEYFINNRHIPREPKPEDCKVVYFILPEGMEKGIAFTLEDVEAGKVSIDEGFTFTLDEVKDGQVSPECDTCGMPIPITFAQGVISPGALPQSVECPVCHAKYDKGK